METTLPKISIVTISYNQGRFLRECIESVLKQGYRNLEYIIVDAGSTDNSRDIIREYGSSIKHAIFEFDRGPADGLNKGFSRSTGSILGYLNADDRFAPSALSFVAKYFEDFPSVDIVSGAVRIIDANGKASPRKRTSDLFDIGRYLSGVCTVCQQATFFRRGAFIKAGGFNPENRVSWDGELLVDFALDKQRFATVHRVLGDFRVYGESITGSGRMQQQYERVVERLRAEVAEDGVQIESPEIVAVRRIMYKLNPLRHLGYLTVR